MFKNTLQGHRRHPAGLQRPRHAVRARVLRHRPPVHGGAFSRPRPACSRRSSFNRCSAFAAASVRIRKTCCTRSARPTGCSATTISGRWSAPDVTRCSSPCESAVLGGHVRVGLEDSLWIGKGRLATSNAEQVAKIRRILEELGLEVATPDDARRMLKLKGARRRRLFSESSMPTLPALKCPRCRGAAEYHVTVEMTRPAGRQDRHRILRRVRLPVRVRPGDRYRLRIHVVAAGLPHVPAAGVVCGGQRPRVRPDRALPVPRSPGRAVGLASVAPTRGRG